MWHLRQGHVQVPEASSPVQRPQNQASVQDLPQEVRSQVAEEAHEEPTPV